ncbi:MAG: 16S rRNA (guanine(527)-N(7))-methyltransferase RsmG [Bryobacteraceae bacterium]
MTVTYEQLLDELLPADLPHREVCASGCARHLRLIEEANRQFNLTRIVDAREAVVKHVVDSVTPWRLFGGAARVVDAGTGAGFPGIPLAFAHPESRWVLIESTGKKARFAESAGQALGLANIEVEPVRAEDWLRAHRVDIVTARAVAPLVKILDLFGPAARAGARLLLYKGPDVDAEIAETAAYAAKRGLAAQVALRYELPEGMGSRTVVQVASAGQAI